MNTLYYGDNLDVLRRHVDDASMCVVYLDPWCSTIASDNRLERGVGWRSDVTL